MSMLAALSCLLAAAFAAGPAQAVGPRSVGHVPTAPAHVLTAPPRPASAGLGAMTTAAVAPQISPSVDYTYVSAGATYTCFSGTLCTLVWDPTHGKYKAFRLYICTTYSLSYWHDTGNFYDAQTGGVRSYFYDQSHNVLRSFTPPQYNVPQNWDAVWYIKNC
jgi:hypothetical protein